MAQDNPYSIGKKYEQPHNKIYQEVVSGETIANRPETQNLLRDVEKGIYAGMLVIEIERLARSDAIDQGNIQRTLEVRKNNLRLPVKVDTELKIL